MVYQIHKPFHYLNLMSVCICICFCTCGKKGMDRIKVTGLTRLEYHFGDASVPPEYHRSFSFLVSKDTLKVAVDSYGNVLFDTTVSISGDILSACAKIIHESGIKYCQEKEAEPCAGGTSESLKLYAGGNLFFSGQLYHCGGNHTGTMSGDTTQLVALLKAQVPGLTKWFTYSAD